MGPTIWQRAIDVVENIHFKRWTDYAAILSANNFTGVMIKVHHGAERVHRTDEEKRDLAGFVNVLRNAGGVKVVGGWGVCLEDPVFEAKLAKTLCQERGFDFYVADAEAAHKDDAGGDSDRSELFTKEFRALTYEIPAALTTYGAAAYPWLLGHTKIAGAGPMDFRPWYRRNFRLLPQAYPNLDTVYSPTRCVDHAKRAGWPLGLVHLMIGLYPDKLGRITASQYIPMLKSARKAGGGSGFSTFIADAMQERADLDYKELAPEIKPFQVHGGALAYR